MVSSHTDPELGRVLTLANGIDRYEVRGSPMSERPAFFRTKEHMEREAQPISTPGDLPVEDGCMNKPREHQQLKQPVNSQNHEK